MSGEGKFYLFRIPKRKASILLATDGNDVKTFTMKINFILGIEASNR